MTRILKELAMWLLLGGVTAGGVYLVQQNRALGQQNRVLFRRAVEPHPGLFVPAYPVTTLDGVPATLGAIGHRQLVIFFRTTCPFCRASTPAWNAVAGRLADDPGIAVYGVALDSANATRAYAAEHEFRFPVIAQPSPRLVALYRVRNVPLILLVNEDGRLAYARLGVLNAPAALDSVVHAAQAGRPSGVSVAQEGKELRRGRRAPY